MAYNINEAVNVSAVSVSKSNQSALPQDDHGGVKSQGQFVFVVTSHITTLTSLVGRQEYHKLSFSTTEVRALGFNPITLSSPYELALSNALQTGLFFGENSELLAQEISKTLLTRFQFTAATLSGRIPIKVVVHVERKRDVTYMPDDSDQPSSVFAPTQNTTFATEEEQEEEKEEIQYDSEDEFMYDEEEETRYDSEDEFMDDEPKGYSECCAFERVKALDDHEISQTFGAEDHCAICLDGFFKSGKKVAKTRCGHVFHESCIDGWLLKCATCPMCRSTCIAIV